MLHTHAAHAHAHAHVHFHVHVHVHVHVACACTCTCTCTCTCHMCMCMYDLCMCVCARTSFGLSVMHNQKYIYQRRGFVVAVYLFFSFLFSMVFFFFSLSFASSARRAGLLAALRCAARAQWSRALWRAHSCFRASCAECTAKAMMGRGKTTRRGLAP